MELVTIVKCLVYDIQFQTASERRDDSWCHVRNTNSITHRLPTSLVLLRHPAEPGGICSFLSDVSPTSPMS
jgi:hypothetical protein